MADEQEAIAPTLKLETPAIEPEQVEEKEAPETVPEPGDEPTSEAEGEEAASEEIEFISVERNGRTYQVPKELEGEFLMQSDYTKKTQGVSDRTKELETREAEISRRLEATEAELDARAELKGVNAEIERFKDFNWQAYQLARQQDPFAADEAWNYVQHLNTRKSEIEGSLSKAVSERTQKAQQSLAKRVEDTLAEAPKIIPGFKAETAADTIRQLVAFAQSEGIPDQVLEANWSPQLLKLLHRAQVGTMALNKSVAPKPQPAPTPLKTVTGKTTPAASKTLADLAKSDDLEGYAKARQAGRVR